MLTALHVPKIYEVKNPFDWWGVPYIADAAFYEKAL